MRRITTTVLAAAAAALLALPLSACGTGNDVTGSTSTDDKPDTTITPATEEAAADDAATEDAGDKAYGLDDVVTYENNVSVSLNGFSRAVSSDYATPDSTPYLKFTIKVDNKSGKTLDVTGLTVNCQYGDDSSAQEADGIFDDGLEGSPSTRLLGGRTISVPWGCALPKGEKHIQIEVAPDYESEPGIFTGDVK
ncbi:hypothetical protein AB0D33_01365 [Streptomyces sp. NPDC048404]|uniref:hypothetical protein n=1 Tax=unclassified Streptomyces TaxID=2593676 RepID=UPI00341E8740